MKKTLTIGTAALTVLLGSAAAQYPGWQHSGSLYVLTTPEGADLPATAQEKDFPLLVRLNGDWFDFSQAAAHGEDLRFADGGGKPLGYQIEEWNAAERHASVWVRIPVIKGNARQKIEMFWGKAGAASESRGSAVFDAANGYASVIHMDGPLKDELGTVTPEDLGTTKARGLIGDGRHFTRGKGIDCGKNITSYPFSDDPFTSEAWFRAEPEAVGSKILYWGRYATRFNGKTGDGNEVALGIDSPPRLCWRSDGPGAAHAEQPYTLGAWTHVAATYENGTNCIYVNGELAGTRSHKAAMSIVRDICMNIGGWRGGNYGYAGDIDEVRVSRVARSPDWMKLQYENQKPLQSLVGPLVQPGSDFAVSEQKVEIPEGGSATLTAKAGGAQKVYWIMKRGNTTPVVAVDQYSYTLDAGRVVGETAFVLQFKAVYPNEVKTRDIPVKIKEEIPEPVFSLRAPPVWDGRETIEVEPEISNLAAMESKGAGDLQYRWTVSGGAVIKEAGAGKLLLKRSQFSGRITVKLVLNNGGADYAATTSIMVTEPARDAWVQRVPGKDEKPEENQFYARDDNNEGALYYNGTLDAAADAVFLKVTADGKPFKTESQAPAADKSYAFTVKLKPGLIKYKVEFGTRTGGVETVRHTVGNLVCGDAYIIQGQSNAEATGPNNGTPPESEYFASEWVRSYGNSLDGTVRGGWCTAIRTRKWGTPDYGNGRIGTVGMSFARILLENHRMPICIMNGAVGGTRIDQHQRNEADPHDPKTIYGRLLTRLEGAKLTHGIRAVLWHQGENNQGSASPTGDYDWKSYQQYFVDLSAAWKQDFPNIRNYYLWQIWPNGCNMGGTPAGDMLLEVQRTLPALYSNMRIMSTLGVISGSSGRGLCHFDLEGYAQVAELMTPLVEQDHYGLDRSQVLSAPNLKRAYFSNAARDEITMEFDQPMDWKDECKAWIQLDGSPSAVSAGKAAGHAITLELSARSEAESISYLSGRTWDGQPDKLLYGSNGIAALAFCSVPIALSAEADPAAVRFEPTLESLKQYETPEWYQDAKLGIYMHWGPQSIPGVDATWYARRMYQPGMKGYKYHVATYGHPSKFGYKDICKLFTAPKFDQAQADRLVALYKKIGARYVVPVAVHHDNFDMWDSKYQPRFNSVVTSGKDVVGMWRKAADKHGLHLGVASHNARSYRWFQPSHGADSSGPMKGVPYDGQDPEYADLYGGKWKHRGPYPDFWYEQMSDVGPPEFEKNFEDRMLDLIDKYHPDLYYTDGGIPFHQVGLNILSHLYNENQKWNDGKLQAVATIKLDWTPNVALNNYEYGIPPGVQHYPWQTDKTMGAEWYWERDATARYKSPEWGIRTLLDAVSRNGNLLLNVPMTAAGELEPETVAMLTGMGECLDIIGEAVFATRCWVRADDGPGNIRFTRNKENTTLYVMNLGWANNELRIKTLGSSRIDLDTLESVSLLGAPGKLTYIQKDNELSIKVPPKAPFDSCAYAFKLTFSGQIPKLK